MKKIIALLLVLMSVLTAGFSVMAAGGEIIADVTYNVPPVFVKRVQTEDAAGYDGVADGIINSRIIVTYSKDMVAVSLVSLVIVIVLDFFDSMPPLAVAVIVPLEFFTVFAVSAMETFPSKTSTVVAPTVVKSKEMTTNSVA